MARPGLWTPEVTARARALWDEGLSAAAIGREIGFTKGQVIGKAWRENWPDRVCAPRPYKARTPRVRTASVAAVILPRPERARKARELPVRTTPRIAEAASAPIPTALPTVRAAPPGHADAATAGGSAAPASAAGARARGRAAYGGPVAAPVTPVVPVTVFRPRRVVERQCAWLLNDKHPWRQCEAVAEGHGVYCPAHHEASRAAVQPKSRPGAWA